MIKFLKPTTARSILRKAYWMASLPALSIIFLPLSYFISILLALVFFIWLSLVVVSERILEKHEQNRRS